MLPSEPQVTLSPLTGRNVQRWPRAHMVLALIASLATVTCVRDHGGGVISSPVVEFYPTTSFTSAGELPVLQPVDAAFGPDGHVYVLDRMAPAVHVYDSSGGFIRTMGRKGEGPGELMTPVALAVSTRSGKLAIADDRLARIVVWTNEGKQTSSLQRRVLGEASIQWGSADQLFIRGVKVSDGVMTTALEEFTLDSLEPREILSEKQTPRSLLRSSASTRVCAYCPVAISAGGLFALAPAAQDAYRVSFVTAAGSYNAAGIEASVSPIELTSAQRNAAAEAIWEMPAHLRPLMKKPGHMPLITGLAFDDRGFLWIETPVSSGCVADVYTPSGSTVERVHFSKQLKILDATTDRVLVMAVDTSLGGFVVQRFDRGSAASPRGQ